MTKFLIRIILFGLIVFSIIFLLAMDLGKNDYKSTYMAAMIDKHNRLSGLKSPRLIFVGGSSTAFGVNSEEMENELGVSVTNMALIAGLGLDFILNETAAVMKSGDTIILAPEYYLDVEGNYELKVYTAKCFPEAKNYFNQDYLKNVTTVKFKEIKDNLKIISNQLFPKKLAVSDYHTIYNNRNSFNAYGDMVGHFSYGLPPSLNDKGKFAYRYYDGIDNLNRFYETAQQKGVKVFYVYHAYAESQYRQVADVIEKYSSDLQNDMKIPILGQPTDFVYPDSLFFDTVLHLNKKGRELRTKKLLQLLHALSSDKKS
ncbi:MAG: hypothetical protein WDO19_19550 [Bacteroidota bacterium]